MKRLHVAVLLLSSMVACTEASAPISGDTGAAGSTDDDATLRPPDADAVDRDGAADELAFGPRRLPGRWYAGDFHVHATGASNDAGEESTPERIKEVAIRHGLDFVVLTDHSNSTGSDTTTREEDPALFNRGPEFPYWEKARELTDESFLMVDGNEISPVDDPAVDPVGHIGCYPRSLETFNPNIAFIDRPRGALTSADIVPQARDAGCFVTVNHPFVAAFWMAFDWTTRDYDALEVFNGGGGWDRFDYDAVRGWACDLALGREVTAIGGSDNHRIEIEPPGTLGGPPIGWPTTWVWSGVLEWPGIIAGLDAAHVTVGDTSVPLELDVYDEAGRWLGLAGSRVAAEEVRYGRLRGALDRSEGESRQLQLVRVAAGACDDTRREFRIQPPEPTLELIFDEEIEPDTEFDLHAEVSLREGDVVFGWLRPAQADVIGKHGAAVTNAVRAE